MEIVAVIMVLVVIFGFALYMNKKEKLVDLNKEENIEQQKIPNEDIEEKNIITSQYGNGIAVKIKTISLIMYFISGICWIGIIINLSDIGYIFITSLSIAFFGLILGGLAEIIQILHDIRTNTNKEEKIIRVEGDLKL
ncbi:MAG: hypothetical protein RR136_03255 [Clostridia bacterium]